MQRIIILFLVVAFAFLFSKFQINKAQNQNCECRFIVESLKEMNEIKAGMTRKNLLDKFKTEGGISTRTSSRYVYKKCDYIKVDVKFKPVADERNNSIESPNDEIVKISKPFLEYVIID